MTKKASHQTPASPLVAKHQKEKPVTLRNNMRPFFGTVTSKSNTNIIVKDRDGNKTTVILSDATKFSGGKKSDVVVGTKVSGVGKVDSKGTIVATSLQISPNSPLNSLKSSK